MKVFIACAVMMFGFLGGISAAVVAGWDVAGIDVDEGIGIETNISPFVFLATTSETAYVEAQLSLGSGVIPSTASSQYGFKVPSAGQTNTLSGSISLNQYIDISISIEAGKALNLHSFEMKGEGSSTACSNVAFMTSIDGFLFAQQVVSLTNANTTGGLDTDDSGFGGPIDLSAARYQNLTGTVSFRLYGWNSTSGSGSTRIRDLTGNDLEILGEIVEIPGNGDLTLFLSNSNGTSYVSAVFDGAATTNHVLQRSTNLASNVWDTVSTAFSVNTNWVVDTTNSIEFFRAVVD